MKLCCQLSLSLEPKIESSVHLATDSIGTSSEKAAVGYFWALVFDALHNAARSASLGEIAKKMIQEDGVAPTIPEQEIEYPLDGIPSKPWRGSRLSRLGPSDAIRNYSHSDIAVLIQQYEEVLDPAQRIQIQTPFEGWMKKFQSNDRNDLPVPDPKLKTS